MVRYASTNNLLAHSEKRALGKRLFAFGMTLVAGLLLVISLVLTAITTAGLQGAATLLGIPQGPLVRLISFLGQVLVTLAHEGLVERQPSACATVLYTAR